MTGTITAIVLDRKFGFISRPGEPDRFFHYSDLSPSLDFDQTLVERRVEFDPIEAPKGPRAVNVQAAT